jgi:hypothetical protein
MGEKLKKLMTWPLGTDQSPPSPPKPPKIKSPDELRTTASESAAEELRKRRRGGRGSTILTGGLEPAPTKKKTLLGQ